MFKLLTNLTDRRSWMIVLCAMVFAGVAGYYGGPVASLMTDGDEGITLGGGAVVGPQMGGTIGEDLARAQMLAFLILFVLLLWSFRGLVAALQPLLVSGLAIVGTFLGLRLVTTEVTPLSVYAVNLVTGLGLGLAIDYSLFIVSRYREEISRSGPGREALLRALLVPSLMKLLGRRNWWSPRPLRWLHERIGLSENDLTEHAPERA